LLLYLVIKLILQVHKQGSLVVRAIDLSKFDGYDGLICELERLFDMEGLLNDKQKKWHVVYTDDENDLMLVGDDPWQLSVCIHLLLLGNLRILLLLPLTIVWLSMIAQGLLQQCFKDFDIHP